MNRSLILAVFTFAAADLVVVGSLAGADGDTEAAEPVVNAFFTGQDAEPQTLGGVEVVIRHDDNGRFYADLSNPGDAPRDFAFDVECYERTGSPFSRVMPPPDLVSTNRVAGTLQPGQRLEQRLGCKVPKQEQPSDLEEAQFLAELGVSWVNSFRVKGEGADAAFAVADEPTLSLVLE